MKKAVRTRRTFWARPRFCQAAFAVSALVGPCSSACAADVSFRSAFDAAAGQDIISITVPDSDVLVVEAGNYYSQGKRIIVMANRARVTGEARIGFYPPESRPPVKPGVAPTGPTGPAGPHRNCGGNGCNGETGLPGSNGAQGDTGAAASSIVLNIGDLTGDGKLTVAAAGQGGGQGQQGGKGGTGGRGGDGAQRSCGGAFGLDTRAGPGNGGTGGSGGQGGVGGTGGPGGAGGTITLSADLTAALNAGKLAVELTPAPGGTGGEPGEPGDPGGAGDMGGGNSCGGGGSSGSGGGSGSKGNPGATGPGGLPGTLRYLLGEDATDDAEPFVAAAAFRQPAVERNCRGTLELTKVVTVPPNRVVVELLPPRLNTAKGIVGMESPPAVQPVPGRPDQVSVRARLKRVMTAEPQIRGGLIPQITLYWNCPPVDVALDVMLRIAPRRSPIGASLTGAVHQTE